MLRGRAGAVEVAASVPSEEGIRSNALAVGVGAAEAQDPVTAGSQRNASEISSRIEEAAAAPPPPSPERVYWVDLAVAPFLRGVDRGEERVVTAEGDVSKGVFVSSFEERRTYGDTD